VDEELKEDDGALLFPQTMLAKIRPPENGGSRIANGCVLATSVLRVVLEKTSHTMLYSMLNNMFQEVRYVAHKPFGRYPLGYRPEA